MAQSGPKQASEGAPGGVVAPRLRAMRAAWAMLRHGRAPRTPRRGLACLLVLMYPAILLWPLPLVRVPLVPLELLVPVPLVPLVAVLVPLEPLVPVPLEPLVPVPLVPLVQYQGYKGY